VPSEQRGAYYQVSYTHRMKSRTEYVRSAFLKELRQQIRDYTKLKRPVAKWVTLGIEHSRLSMRGRSK
jgi:hypothetical protein